MKTLFKFIVLLLTPFASSVYGQEPKYYFDLVINVMATENSSKNILQKLDSLKSTLIPSRSSVSSYFDRDIDFGYRHQRITLRLNLNSFQIDLLKKADTVYTMSVKQYVNPFEVDSTLLSIYSHIDTTESLSFLTKRNALYNSHKQLADLLKELAKPEVFAFHCGDGSPKTEQGWYIEELVDNKNIYELTNMLQSICVETQAYGISGLEMLMKKNIEIPIKTKMLIMQIKKRNSQTVICSGCLTGLIEKIYTKNKNAYR